MPIQTKNKRKDYSIPVSLGLLGTGYGLSRLGKTMFSPADEANALQAGAFLDTIKSLPEEEKMPEYVKRMTDGVKTKLWGYSPVDVMKAFRTYLPEMITGKGHKWDATKDDQGIEASAHHYDFFSRGPLEAFREMIPGAGAAAYPNKSNDAVAKTMVSYDKAIKDIAEKYDLKEIPSTRDKELNGPSYSTEDQKRIYANMLPEIKENNPELYGELQDELKTQGSTAEKNYQGYSGLINTVLGARNKLLIAGTAATVGGLGILGLWAVKKYRALEREKDKTKYKKPVSIDLPVAGANFSFH